MAKLKADLHEPSQVIAARRGLVMAGFALSVLVLAGVARAQASRTPVRVGYLTSQLQDYFFESFEQRLGELGYVNGRNISIDKVNMEGRLEQAQRLILELAKKNPNVMVLPNVALMNAARQTGLQIPFVVNTSVDPVETGFATSLSRPGGNFTGIANLQRDLSAKRLEVLRELLPKMSRLAVLWDVNGPGPKVAATAYEAAAQRLKWQFQSLPIRNPEHDLGDAFREASAKKADAVVLVSNPLIAVHRAEIAALIARWRLPVVGEHDYWADSGVLFTFGASIPDIGRRMADIVHRILQGEKPGNVPFEQPTKFDFVLNKKTAKALGIKIPQSVLVRADKVIE